MHATLTRISWPLLSLVLLAPPLAWGEPPPAEPLDGLPAVLPCGQAPAGMACIAGGPFLRGTDKGPKDARPQETIWLQTFFMDTHEVTVEAYDACVAEKKCQPAKTAYGKDYLRPRQPKVGQSWYHAVAFCKARGKHLPTEAEWEKAARGADGRTYPWGEEPATCERAVIMDAQGKRSCGTPWKGFAPEKGRTYEVGTRPPNPYGLYDMAGNAWEWVNDWYTPYAKCGPACRGQDPRGPCGGAEPCKGMSLRVVRGGSWYWPAEQATTFYRRQHVPSNNPYHHYGFRCAASLAEATALSAPPPPP
jgi:formylglycine-generating enzyme